MVLVHSMKINILNNIGQHTQKRYKLSFTRLGQRLKGDVTGKFLKQKLILFKIDIEETVISLLARDVIFEYL